MGTKRAPDDSVYPTMLVQTQNLSEYDWAEEIGGKGQGGPGGEGGAWCKMMDRSWCGN